MDESNYQPCGAHLSQGDLVRAPIGLFAVLAEIQDPSVLGGSGGPLALGDPRGTGAVLPRLVVGGAPTAVRAWYLPAVVVSPDCDLDKSDGRVLLAPILPLDAYEQGARDALRAGQYVSALDLPPEPRMALSDGSEADFPHSVVDLRQTTTVTPGLILGQRMVALSPEQIDRLHQAWIRFIALREISSTGTIAAAAGKRILEARTVESSRKRHTVLLTLEDDSVLVLYQEPRRAGAHVQQGNFPRNLVG